MTQCNCKLYARGGAGGGGGSQQRAEVADGADVVFTDTVKTQYPNKRFIDMSCYLEALS